MLHIWKYIKAQNNCKKEMQQILSSKEVHHADVMLMLIN